MFPHNIGLGATRDPALVSEVEHVTAEETRTTEHSGICRVHCVACDDRWGRMYESFWEEPTRSATWRPQLTGSRARPAIYRIPTARSS